MKVFGSYDTQIAYSENPSIPSPDHYAIECGEKIPLLAKPSARSLSTKDLNASALVMGLFFGVGLMIGIYLLIQQSLVPNIRLTFDFVDNDIWNEDKNFQYEESLNYSNVHHVIIFHTGGETCQDSEACYEELKTMQKNFCANYNTSLPYNFLIGSNAQIFEVRGWDYASGFTFIPRSSSFTIGFIGNFTSATPSQEQLDAGLALINESLRRGKLMSDYQIYGVRNLSLSHIDGSNLFREIALWDRFDTLLEIL